MVRGDSDGLRQLAATASGTAYGSTLTTTSSATVAVDSTPPSVTIATSARATTNPVVAVSWGAADSVSGVAGYDLDVATDGGPYLPWLTATTQTAATFTGNPGHRYRFRVRATDRAGNVSAFVSSSEVSVDSAAPFPPQPWIQPPPTGGGLVTADPALGITRSAARGGTLNLTGSVARGARGRVDVAWRAKIGRRIYTAHAVGRITGGRFAVKVRIPAKARRARVATVTVSYPGDGRFGATVRRFTVRSR